MAKPNICMFIYIMESTFSFLNCTHNHPSPNLATNKKKIVLIKAMPSVKVNL